MTSGDHILNIDEGVARAAAVGKIEPGQAQRVRIVARLAGPAGRVEEPSCPIPLSTRAVSGVSLAGSLGISRAAIHKHVSQLRGLGFDIQATRGNGYRLESPYADLLVPEAVLPLLLGAPGSAAGIEKAGGWIGAVGCLREGRFLAGLPYFHEDQVESTNLHLKTAAPTGLACGALSVTDYQVGGQGRLGRRWISEPGRDLTFSVLLRPNLGPGQAHLLSLAAAVAVAETLEALLGIDTSQLGSCSDFAREPGSYTRAERIVAIKWPNDVLLGGRKVCGILLEGSMDADQLRWAVAGLGVNVNGRPGRMLEACGEAFSGGVAPVSLREHLGGETPRGWLLARLLERLTLRWSEVNAGFPAPGCPDLMTALRERDALAGSAILVRSGLRGGQMVTSGIAAGIGTEGELLVREPSGFLRAIFAGEVTLAPGRSTLQ